ncbi:MAG: NAD(P)H-dependent glycerol-3-phosphate dehydrogenase [Gammaproteobacteria bacterium]
MPADKPVLVVGAGAWGTALASVFARAGCHTFLTDSDVALIDSLARERRHPRFCSEVALEENLEPTTQLGRLPALAAVVFVVPYQVLRAAVRDVLAGGVETDAIGCASKGMELGSLALAHEIVADACGDALPFAQLSGPNFAAEVMQGAPAAMTIAASTPALGETLAAAMHGPRFRPYLSNDIIGVEVGGALKNVIAIAAGIVDGLALGANTRAAVITRGLAEIARFGCARGGRMETFMGLSGMGDLVLTCTDDQSRNRRFGLALARSGSVEEAAAEVGALVEGVATARALAGHPGGVGVDMPLASAVAAIIDGRLSVDDAVESLLARDPRHEDG